MFHRLTTICAVLFSTLAPVLLIAPAIIYWLFGLEAHALGDFMSKRAAMLFVGLATLCWLARNSQSAEVQRLVAAVLGLSMGGMALVGLFEFARSNAGLGIWLAILPEALIAALYARMWLARAQP